MRQKVGRRAGWTYLSLWGQPVHLGAVREIYWVSREIHIQLRAQCWGYQTFQRGDGTSPALWTTGWTVHSESDIFLPARELWPVRGRKSQETRRKMDRSWGKCGKRAGRKSSLTEQLSTQTVNTIIIHSKQSGGKRRWARVNVHVQQSFQENYSWDEWNCCQVPRTSPVHTYQNWQRLSEITHNSRF